MNFSIAYFAKKIQYVSLNACNKWVSMARYQIYPEFMNFLWENVLIFYFQYLLRLFIVFYIFYIYLLFYSWSGGKAPKINFLSGRAVWKGLGGF